MEQRANMREFATIAGLILEAMLESHPIMGRVSENRVMILMKVDDPTQKLESGRMFKEVFTATLNWLIQEGFVSRQDIIHGYTLTTKALAVLNAVPPNLSGKSIGDSLVEAKEGAGTSEGQSRIATFFGDLIGSAAGSFTKSVGSGG